MQLWTIPQALAVAIDPTDPSEETASALGALSTLLWPYSFAVAGMISAGSWGNMCLLANVRFEFFFLDYAFGNLLSSTLYWSSSVESLKELASADAGAQAVIFGLTLVAGALYAMAILLLVRAIKSIGLSLAVPLVVGIEFVVGVPLLMCTEGAGSPAHMLLSLLGVAAVIGALACDSLCHTYLAADQARAAKLRQLSAVKEDPEEEAEGAGNEGDGMMRRNSASWHGPPPTTNEIRGIGLRRSSTAPNLSFRTCQGTSLMLLAVQEGAPVGGSSDEPSFGGAADGGPQAQGPGAGPSGFTAAIFAGVLASVWPALSSIVEGNGLGKPLGEAAVSPQAFFSLFVVGAVCTAAVGSPLLFHWQSKGAAFWDSYFAISISSHAWAVFAGVIQGVGNALTLQGGQRIGNTVAIAIQRCAPLVSALWGILFWGELDGARRASRMAFAGMIVAFIAAVCLLIAAGLSDESKLKIHIKDADDLRHNSSHVVRHVRVGM